MTEEEAKTKWCPFVRYMQAQSGEWDNNRPKGHYNACCIGSACMSWRTDWAGHGYCGLAGKP